MANQNLLFIGPFSDKVPRHLEEGVYGTNDVFSSGQLPHVFNKEGDQCGISIAIETCLLGCAAA